MSRLNYIQKNLKAPKGQKNTFGNYNYRSCEDILEAVKPMLENNEVVLLTDEIVQVGDRFYVKATATLKDETTSVSVSAFAREPLDKKGMDASQITGATSSYARKYALNGLFCIDDNKDSDTKDNNKKQAEEALDTAPAIKALNGAKNVDDLKTVYLGLKPEFQTNPKVKALANKLKANFLKNENKPSGAEDKGVVQG